jgi:hypothetical protein
MSLPTHLQQFLDINTAGRVMLMCRARKIFEADKAALYTRAVKQAVSALCRDSEPTVVAVDQLLNQQLEWLDVALARPPVPRLPPRPTPAPVEPLEEVAKPRGAHRAPGAGTVEALSMEKKLQESRKPLKELLLKDCVQLRLMKLDRAKKLASHLAGRRREDAEADIVAELRDSLHQQVRAYMRKHQGGPWDSVRKQEDLRLDITHTNSVHSLVILTRQLLKERKDWEARLNKGLLHNLLGGRIKASSGGNT